jgi:hypothetical protein
MRGLFGANDGDKLAHAFCLPHRHVGRRGREHHRAPGWCRRRSIREGDLTGRMSALAGGTNHPVPRARVSLTTIGGYGLCKSAAAIMAVGDSALWLLRLGTFVHPKLAPTDGG